MKRELPKFVYPKGKRGYLYFCRGKTTQRIQADFGTPEFWAEYAIALKGRAPVRPGKTFTALIESYKRSNRFSRLAPRTKADYDKVLTFIVDRIGGLDPAKMQRRSVIAYRDENAGAVRFANYLVQILRILFEHAHDIGWRNDNPAKGVSLLKSTAAPREPWPADLVEAFRAKATGPALLIFELCLGTGQRISDVLRMRWNDIEAGGVNVTQGKTGARLWVPLTPQLRAVLAVTAKDGLTIVTTRGGRMMSYKTAQGHVMRVRLQIGGEGHDIHGLRHTAASELARLGCSDELIQSVTGHSSARMVAHYAGAARQKARAKEAQERRE
ncbi:site-specific integrase [Pararhodobacter zhoushanensis]|uniref:site-specific integrase n=1 Tax=Pararhodobacter zhoushanensis TaxID=2479545 RepID=UPI000F8DBF18|nr:tyrosine-type recombinase/integrase [Pararhodobacter zhoushanensis]